jgi:hypothetical protein
MGGTQVKAQSGSVVRERKMTRVDWSRTFWQEAKIDLKHSGGVAAAFVPRTLSSMTFIVRHGKQSPSGEQEEVWVADAGGVRPKLILREKESRLSHIQWSPSGEYMAYVASPTAE